MIWQSKASDEDLLDRTGAGDERAFTTLYRRHQRAVFGFALLMSGSESIAADATQEAFIELLKGKTAFEPARGSVRAWLCGLARNCVRRHRREFDAPLASPEDDQSGDEAAHESGQPLASLERSRATAAVRRGLARLEPQYREVVILCALQEFSYAQAALICGIEVHLVRSRLARGKGRLATILGEAKPWQERQAA